jgi:O-antigen/teichoic acid export membrane protein
MKNAGPTIISGAQPYRILSKLGRRRPTTRSVLAFVNSAWGQAANALCALLGIRVYTELLTKSQFGYAMMAMGGVALIDGLLIMAFNQTLLSLCGQIGDREGQRTVAAGLAYQLIRVGGAIGCIALLITLLLSVLFGWGSIIAALVATAFIYVVSELLKTSMLSPLVANRQYFRYSLWTSVEAAFVLISIASALKLFNGHVLVYLVSLVIGRTASTLLFFAIYFKGRYFCNIDLEMAKRTQVQALRYAWPVSLMAPLAWTATYLDRYILSAVGGAAITGVYSAGVSLVARPYALTSSVLTNYFRPRLYTSDAGSVSPTLRRRIQTQWIACALMIGTSGSIGFATGGAWVASLLLAPEYRTDVTFLLTVLGLSQTFTLMTHAVDNAILSTGASALLLKTQVPLAAVSSLLIPLAILLLGVRGAVIGRCVAESIKFTCTFLVASRCSPERQPL